MSDDRPNMFLQKSTLSKQRTLDLMTPTMQVSSTEKDSIHTDYYYKTQSINQPSALSTSRQQKNSDLLPLQMSSA